MDLDALKEEIRARADIVDVVGRHVRLQKAGGTHKGLCPFHQEKSPSFNVDPRKQAYHCFGCGAGGDVFNFVMEFEHVDFMSAMERLANQVGVPFEFDGHGDGQKGPKKDRLFSLHEQAATYFQRQLNAPETGRIAREYLDRRQLKPQWMETFGVGFAPESFSALLEAMRDQGFTQEELEASGLFAERENAGGREKLYDRFRERLMFPIRDELGRVIGFSGRILDPAKSKAKYVNSPETILFKKSRVLYGIDRARKPMAEKRRAILCEGQLDVIRCHEAGVDTAVAAQGTAITAEHATILKRYADEVILLLDADEAGVKAALRSAESLLQVGLAIRVASLPPGEDPDSLMVKNGPKALHAVIESALTFMAFQVKALMAKETDANESSRLRVAREVMATIGHAPEAVHREELIRQAAEALGMRPEALRADVKPVKPVARAVSGEGPARPRGPANPLSGAAKEPPAERYVLELLCHSPGLLPEATAYLQARHFRHGEYRAIYELLAGLTALTPEGILDAVREHPARNQVHALLKPRPAHWDGARELEALRELILLLRTEELQRRKTELLGQMGGTPPGDARDEMENESWQLAMVVQKLQECRKKGDWTKAAMILEMYA